MAIIPQLATRAAPRGTADVGREHLYTFPLVLLFADDQVIVGPLYYVGDNSFTLRLGASGLGATAVELFILQLDPFTLDPILDPLNSIYYNNALSFGAAATTLRIGANVQPPTTAFDTGVQVGPFSLVFYTGLGNYSSSCWLEGYHTQGQRL